MWQVKIDTLEKKNNFYSHIPCGMWLKSFASIFWGFSISTHTSRVGCDEEQAKICYDNIAFYSHTSCVIWPTPRAVFLSSTTISPHTSRVGCDGAPAGEWRACINFYSHIPCGMWHHSRQGLCDQIHFYSHIPCGMWQFCLCKFIAFFENFYSHIPCGMWRCLWNMVAARKKFLLTHPVWDVTSWCLCSATPYKISTHPSRVGCGT